MWEKQWREIEQEARPSFMDDSHIYLTLVWTCTKGLLQSAGGPCKHL
jgi:hypothetical protein